jgi:hypothetical protein
MLGSCDFQLVDLFLIIIIFFYVYSPFVYVVFFHICVAGDYSLSSAVPVFGCALHRRSFRNGELLTQPHNEGGWVTRRFVLRAIVDSHVFRRIVNRLILVKSK